MDALDRRRKDAARARLQATSTHGQTREEQGRRAARPRIGAWRTSFVVRTANGIDGTGETRRCQYWLQSTAVELVPRRTGETRDDLGSAPPRHADGQELCDRSRSFIDVRPPRFPRP